MDISVIIVNYCSWGLLENCLQSLQNIEQEEFSFEVIVVDNSLDKKKLNRFKQQFSNFSFYANEANTGFSHGNNLGVKKAKGNYYLFLNPDTIISKAALFDLFNAAKKNVDLGVISCQQINEKGKKQDIRKLFPTGFTHFGISRALYRLINKKQLNKKFSNKKKQVFPDWASGSILLIPKIWFKKVNGWCEDFWLYYEDVDICKRIQNLGGKIVILQNTSITHKHGGSSRINLELKALTKTEVIISNHVYIDKHFKGISRYFFQIILMFSILIEKFIFAILGILFFFIPKLKMNVILFYKLIKYYTQALLKRSWLSPRSVNF
jgi:GT2 family glycosyltransferase